jgi:hypothetical protein
MRSVLARLFFVALAGGVIAGCSIAGSSQSNGSLPNGNGGGSVPTTNNPGASTKTAPPLTENPVQIDNGTEETPSPVPSGSKATPGPVLNVYKAILGATSSDTNVSGGVGPSPYPTGGPATAPTDYPSSSFSHVVTFTGSGTSQVVLQFSKTLPSLTYVYNSTAPTGSTPTSFAYSSLVLYLIYIPSTTAPPGTLASVSAEISGSDAAGSFDVRVPCKGTPGDTTAAFGRLACGPLPALGAIANTAGPNPVLPGSVLGYDPVTAFAPKFSVVLNYTTPVPTTSTGNVLDITNVYALQ